MKPATTGAKGSAKVTPQFRARKPPTNRKAMAAPVRYGAPMRLPAPILPPPAYEFEAYTNLVQGGIPAKLVVKLAGLIGKSKEEVFQRLDISRATAHRLERNDKKIGSLESDAMADMVRVIEKARAMLGSDANLRHWLDLPVPALNFKTPWACMPHSLGRRDVGHLLDAIAAGTFA